MRSLIESACEAQERFGLDELEAYAATHTPTLKTTTGYLSCSDNSNGEPRWRVLSHNQPLCADTDYQTALDVARQTFGEGFEINVWLGNFGQWGEPVSLSRKAAAR